jgi:hypothetical protein
MAEFTIGQNKYRTRKLDAFEQLLIVKRLAAAIKNAITPDLVASLMDKASSNPMQGFAAFAEALGKMPDDDFLFILNACCKATMREQEGQWFPLMREGTHMYRDISAAGYIQIAFKVLQEDLGSFFEELRSILGMDQEETLSK